MGELDKRSQRQAEQETAATLRAVAAAATEINQQTASMLVSLYATLEGAESLQITCTTMAGDEIGQMNAQPHDLDIACMCRTIRNQLKNERNVNAQLLLADGTLLDSCQVIRYCCADTTLGDLFGLEFSCPA